MQYFGLHWWNCTVFCVLWPIVWECNILELGVQCVALWPGVSLVKLRKIQLRKLYVSAVISFQYRSAWMIKTDGKEAWGGNNPAPWTPGDASLILRKLSSHYPSSLFPLVVRSGRVYQRCSCVCYLYSWMSLYLGCRQIITLKFSSWLKSSFINLLLNLISFHSTVRDSLYCRLSFDYLWAS